MRGPLQKSKYSIWWPDLSSSVLKNMDQPVLPIHPTTLNPGSGLPQHLFWTAGPIGKRGRMISHDISHWDSRSVAWFWDGLDTTGKSLALSSPMELSSSPMEQRMQTFLLSQGTVVYLGRLINSAFMDSILWARSSALWGQNRFVVLIQATNYMFSEKPSQKNSCKQHIAIHLIFILFWYLNNFWGLCTVGNTIFWFQLMSPAIILLLLSLLFLTSMQGGSRSRDLKYQDELSWSRYISESIRTQANILILIFVWFLINHSIHSQADPSIKVTLYLSNANPIFTNLSPPPTPPTPHCWLCPIIILTEHYFFWKR